MTKPIDEPSPDCFEMPRRLADSVKAVNTAQVKSGGIYEPDEEGAIPDAPLKKDMPGENLPLVGKLIGRKRRRTRAGCAHLADGHSVLAAEQVGNIVAGAMVMSAIANPP